MQGSRRDDRLSFRAPKISIHMPKNTLKELKDIRRELVERKPTLVHKLTKQGRTLVCIEGFPRSGNSFACELLKQAGLREMVGRMWHVAHHSHKVQSVLLAVNMDLPTIVLIRDPRQAIESVLIYGGEEITDALIDTTVNRYLRFYRGVDSVRDRVFISDFSLHALQPEEFIRQVNARFGWSFVMPEVETTRAAFIVGIHEAIKARSERHHHENAELRQGTPSEEREQLRAAIGNRVADHALLPKCQNLYAGLIARA